MIGVKRVIALMLLVGALFGLVGQEAVYAANLSVPALAASDHTASATTMSADCARMMQAADHQGEEPGDSPCGGKAPCCMAKMGCGVSSPAPAALIPAVTPAAFSDYWSMLTTPRVIVPMIGREPTPELHPPAHLG